MPWPLCAALGRCQEGAQFQDQLWRSVNRNIHISCGSWLFFLWVVFFHICIISVGGFLPRMGFSTLGKAMSLWGQMGTKLFAGWSNWLHSSEIILAKEVPSRGSLTWKLSWRAEELQLFGWNTSVWMTTLSRTCIQQCLKPKLDVCCGELWQWQQVVTATFICSLEHPGPPATPRMWQFLLSFHHCPCAGDKSTISRLWIWRVCFEHTNLMIISRRRCRNAYCSAAACCALCGKPACITVLPTPVISRWVSWPKYTGYVWSLLFKSIIQNSGSLWFQCVFHDRKSYPPPPLFSVFRAEVLFLWKLDSL